MSAIVYREQELEVEEKEAEEENAPEPEIFSLPEEEIERILAQDRASMKTPRKSKDPCLLESRSEDLEKDPETEYQDSMEAAGYPYW